MKWKPMIAAAALVSAASAAQATAVPQWCAEGKPVRFAGVTWESAQFFTAIASFIVANGYGCKIESVSGSTAVTEAALVANDLQVWMEQWERTNVIKQGRNDGKIALVGSILTGGTREGWFVPAYLVHGDPKRGIKASAPELKSVADLPRYKHLFKDDEEPTRGRFLNCPSGWDCERINNQKFKAYKLAASYTNFRPGTGGALDATISSAYERGKPILFYYWSPAGLMGKYQFIQLQEPEFSEKCWRTLQNNTTDAVCGSGTPSSKLTIGVATPFIKGAPDIIAFFDKFSVAGDIVNHAITEMRERKVDAAVLARDFLQKNKALWKQWVPADVAEKVDSKL
ncbi:ABC transporter substrate-binding protein [Paraherbaspirillum soli]|uniref:ABC transporter substrate-binding protein n=1 Tax=Paraherbaspirillum soli TaxID=631222 RepID=A0ABW0ME87_9BURK